MNSGGEKESVRKGSREREKREEREIVNMILKRKRGREIRMIERDRGREIEI